jgi:hypothetical protein
MLPNEMQFCCKRYQRMRRRSRRYRNLPRFVSSNCWLGRAHIDHALGMLDD